MIEYEPIEYETVKSKKCVKVQCDMCGCLSDCPETGDFDYCSVGTAHGTLKVWDFVEGDYAGEELDLCPECGSWLIEQIQRQKITRPKEKRGT